MDKVEKIRAEIERLMAEYDKWIEEQGVRRKEWARLKEDVLDTVSEEPDKSLEEAAEEYCKTIFHKLFSENPQEEQIVYDPDKYKGFIAGAKWQYQKDRGEFAKIKAKTWCEGFDACKEQLMKENHTSEDLEQAANNYLDGVYGKLPHSDLHIAIFIAGAKWQAKHLKRLSDEQE